MSVQLATTDLDRYASVPEAAARLGVSPRTAYRMIANNEFPVATVTVAGKTKVSLRRLVDHINEVA
jgi:excisionase family DNA binding protein